MSRKIFHRIDEIPRMYLKNNSKAGPKYIKNPPVWIFGECSVVPWFCFAAFYKDTIKEILSFSNYSDNPLICWAYAVDLFSDDIKTEMIAESFKRNFYKDLLYEQESKKNESV